MAFDDLLPDRFDVLEISEAVVAGRAVETVTVIATGKAGRVLWRSPGDVVHDAEGRILEEADVLTRYPLELGHAIEVDGRRLVVSGRVNAARAARNVHNYSAPVRTG